MHRWYDHIEKSRWYHNLYGLKYHSLLTIPELLVTKLIFGWLVAKFWARNPKPS